MNQEADELPEPSETDSSLPAENGNEDYYDEPGKIQRTLDYMETERGHEVTLRFVSILEQLSPAIKALVESKIEAERTRPMWDFRKWLSLLIVRLLVFVMVLWA